MFKSIRWKLTVIYLSLVIVVLFFFGFILKGSLESYFISQLENNLINEARLVRSLTMEKLAAAYPFTDTEFVDIDTSITQYSADLQARITVIGAVGEVLGDSSEEPQLMENHSQRKEVAAALAGEIGKTSRYSDTTEMNMKYVALPVESEQQIIGVVRLALPLTEVEEILANIFSRLLQAGLIAIVISLLIGLSVTKRITNPIERMTYVAGRMARGYLDQKIRLNSKDELGRLSSAFNDMASRLKAKLDEISGEKNKMEAILSSIGDGVIAVDKDGRIILFNPTAEELFEVKEERILGKYTLEVMRNHKLGTLIMNCMQQQEDISAEIELLYPSNRIIRVHATRIKDGSKEHGVVAVFRDVTELRRLEQMRTEFVGNVSHELKTPLTSIKGYTETLLTNQQADFETNQQFLQIINDEADRLEQLISELLDLAELESRDSSLAAVDLEEVLTDVLMIISPKATSKEISLEVDLPTDIAKVKGSREELNRLYTNLIDNAVKYTPAGGQVKIEVEEQADQVWTYISDTGIGIPAEDLERIFERFYRVDKTRSRKLGGTGLGLSIVKHIIKNHQAEIEVESEVGVGTEFKFYLNKFSASETGPR
ncbi:two-component system histidine kinase PnpS [Fuchsiella alkaliacetigena]|uniref:two-component system histidine kinase PnpS n=1 Tax=Fuchsiella alkaliacetigena TaxID=957042 RepID=UPI00200A2E1E|nr:ATP-binding protein [Fuchsiella alkaliacetigena]MCK8824664.1 cell wall metabolism sensor histidine kinase WalK [Fuchsiella alkaliacetigena]